MKGYLYIRQHPSWDKFNCYKIGITENIINRESQYLTSEIERGMLIKIFYFQKILKKDLYLIEKIIKNELNDYHYYCNAGTEFFKSECILQIKDILNKFNFDFIELTKDDIELLTRKIYKQIKLNKNKIINPSIKFKLRNDQLEILNKCILYYEKNNKGLLNLPCGFGKTVLSLFLLESLNLKKIIIGVPNKLLLNQWYNIIQSCINNNCIILKIYNNITIKNIKYFLDNNTNYIIICTYSSSYKLYKASRNIKFDILINDEAHHLTSINKENKENKKYINILNINIIKQLSLTATLKVLDKNYFNIQNNIISNDNTLYFGNIIDKKTLLWAINNNIICDYEIQTIITQEQNILDLLEELKITIYEEKCLFASAYISILSILKEKSHHLLIYCNKIENCIKINNFINLLLKLFNIHNLYNNCFHGKLHKNIQDNIIKNFINSKYSIISCVYCLGEGWDLPLLDGVVFAENMQSNIRIIQSALRGCRKNKNEPNKINKIILPIMNNISNNNLINLFQSNDFSKVKEIIIALGLEDENINSKFKIYNSTTNLYNKNSNKILNNINFEFNEEITNKFILKSIPRELFTISYEKAKNIIKINNIQTLEDYITLCQKDNRLLKSPDKFYKNWINWVDYLSIDNQKYYNYNLCKSKIKEYKKIIPIKSLDYYNTCLNLYKYDNKFPPPGLWNDYYKLNNLKCLFTGNVKKFK